ncbi:MAG: glycosyltransferase family 4 protein [Clostridia bacterium]
MRIFWVSNAPFSKTGYGVQTNLFLSKLQEMGHDLACLCYYGLEGGAINFNKIVCYPKAAHPYGMDILAAHAMNFKSDIIVSLMDAWVFDPRATGGLPWIAYYPVDHEPIPEKVRTNISQAFARIAMSKFGVEETHKAGLDCYYLPHAVNTNLYKPIDKLEAREKLKLPKDAFIIGTVAMNKGLPARKNFAPMLEAFANFKRRHTDAIYYLHTEALGIDNQSFNIPEYANQLGLRMGKDIFLPDQYQKFIGYDDNWMSLMYSSLDVHLLASMGEGFGIPTLEAQACGCPVIVGDWTASGELCFAGQKIDKKDALRNYTGLASYQYIPHTRQIERALELERDKPSNRERARRLAEEYSIENIAEKYLKPTFMAIEKDLGEIKERYAKVDEARAK